MKRKAKAIWNGQVTTGSGIITTESNILNATQYSFKTRFENGIGTNPEELLAAANAGCYSMAVSVVLTQAGFIPGDLNTEAVVELDLKTFSITSMELKLSASKIEGLSAEQFKDFAHEAKNSCIISKALSVPATLEIAYL